VEEWRHNDLRDTTAPVALAIIAALAVLEMIMAAGQMKETE
jgi:hypothetical protein